MTEIATVPKAHSFQTGQRYQSLMFENLNENCVNISRPYILYFPRNKRQKAFRSDRVSPVRVHYFK